MGLTGWVTHLVRRGPLVFNIQDVFPDAAVETGAITNERIIAVARWLERISYHRAAAVTVLSDDLRDNVVAKVKPSHRNRVHVIPNFVDTDFIVPGDRLTPLRAELAAVGHTSKEIAAHVNLSPRTVDSHLARAFRKLGITRRSSLNDALLHDDSLLQEESAATNII
jgi:colanic acid biosynthesis glycosyl transferase WcaI